MILRARRARPLAALLFPIFVLILVWPIAAPVTGQGDAFQFWYAGHLVVSGDSPYRQEAWGMAGATFGAYAGNIAANCRDPYDAVCVWLYPPLTAWLFAPFGALPLEAGLALLEGFCTLVALAGVSAAVWTLGPAGLGARSVLIGAIIASHPFIVTVRQSHPIGLLLLGVVLVALGLRQLSARGLLPGALIIAVKPHLFPLTALSVAADLVARRAWRQIATVTAVIVAAVGAAAAADGRAIPAILQRAGSKGDLGWSTTWAIGANLGEPASGLVVAALLVGAALAAAVAYRSAENESRAAVLVATSTALSLAITPYSHPYDLLLLAPALALVARNAERRSGTVAVAALAIGFPSLTWLLLVARVPALLDTIILVALALSTLRLSLPVPTTARVGSA